MKHLIYLISAIIIFSISESFSQHTWPFNDCYQAEFERCNQSCTDSLKFTKTIMHNGCPIDVSYKVRICQCPEPTAFVYITYLRIDISEPQACCDLICQLFPPGPYVQNCDKTQHHLNCINNPADTSALHNLYETMYSAIVGTVFDELSDNYLCPVQLTIKYYWPGSCFGFCIYGVTDIGPSATPTDYIFVPTACSGEGCCSRTYNYCKNEQGETIVTLSDVYLPAPCPSYVIPECLEIFDTIDLDGTTYLINLVLETECVTPCDEGG